MKEKKVLFITQEITPFNAETPMSLFGRQLPQAIQEEGYEIRTFAPKWGNVNERRNQLHEVIRLSGLNIIIDGTDHPLIIKVASLPQARMQIYFIDNDDYFQKRGFLHDKEGNEYTDNGERAIFYARGVLETVKKLRWIPNVIHCHGWISALAPLYIRQAYQDDPSFADTKIIFSAPAPEFQTPLEQTFIEFLTFKGAHGEDVADLASEGGVTYTDLCRIAIRYSDAYMPATEDADPSLAEYARELGKPVLDPQSKDTYGEAFSTFFEAL